MILESLVVGPFGCNCVVLGSEETGEAVVIDPGDDPEEILRVLDEHRLAPRYLLHTHAHLDHIGASEPLRAKSGGKICLHEEDLFLAEMLPVQAALFGLSSPPVPTVDLFLKDGDYYGVGEISCEVIHTPGHTPGSVCFSLKGRDLLLTGDTLFAGSIGRTDLWGGSYEAILRSIRGRLLIFPDATVILPGHGPKSTIGRERRNNPFLQDG
jgi:glyoxylase-like metal-dependent hydrolase (beta-lactamase superfamily II)